MHFSYVCFVTIQVFLLFWSLYSPLCFVMLFCDDSLEALKCDFTCRTSPVSLWLLLRQEVQDVEDKRLQWPMGWQKQGALGLITEKTVAAELADSPPPGLRAGQLTPSKAVKYASFHLHLATITPCYYVRGLCESRVQSHTWPSPPFCVCFVRKHKAMSV